tara:strand:+ start:26025 stop:27272 length:1248 start_codon:yes stop_codon:yes gene_type:complete
VILHTNSQINSMKKILSIVSIFLFFSASAQNNFLFPDSSDQIIINSIGGVASTSIPQKFMNKFIFPDYIDNDLKNSVSNKIKANNYFGGGFLLNANLLLAKENKNADKKNLIGFGFGTNREANLKFPKDLFDLTFYGNKPFANETLNLNKTSFESLSYSYLELSVGQSFINGNVTSSFWSDIGLLVGHNFSDINFAQASLFTEENGDYLEFNLSESSIAVSDTLSTSLAKGFGAKIDLFYSRQTENSKLLISAENMGGIFWQNSSSAQLDTTFNFEGIEIGDIFQLADSVWSELGSIDSLLNSEKKNEFRTVPVDITVYYRKNLELILFDVLVNHKLFANYTPYIRTGLNFNLPLFNPGATIAYGGYSGLRAGLNTDIKIIDALKIQIGTNNILGAIIPDSATSLDAYAGVRLKF